jgi:hypothetical protein
VRDALTMQLHPSLSRQIALTRDREVRAAAARARLVRAARSTTAPRNDVRRQLAVRRGCEDPALA